VGKTPSLTLGTSDPRERDGRDGRSYCAGGRGRTLQEQGDQGDVAVFLAPDRSLAEPARYRSPRSRGRPAAVTGSRPSDPRPFSPRNGRRRTWMRILAWWVHRRKASYLAVGLGRGFLAPLPANQQRALSNERGARHASGPAVL